MGRKALPLTAKTRRRLRLWAAWFYIGVVLPVCVYLAEFHPELWSRYGLLIVLVISVETAASTHFAGAAADTPMED
jgi:hypothetical protein